MHKNAIMEQKISKYKWFIFSALMGISIIVLTLKMRLIVNSDSVSGFEAGKSCFWIGQFNYSNFKFDSNLNVVDKSFLSWWSPGQYIFPNILQSLFKWKFGIILNFLTVLCLFIGLIGYFKLFQLFKIEKRYIYFSIALILSSFTFYYNLISYQGGEILSFCFFPWAIISIMNGATFNKIIQILLGVLIILLGFICKSAMLITFVFVFLNIGLADEKLFFFKRFDFNIIINRLIRFIKHNYHYLIIIIIGYSLLKVFYIDKGVNPSSSFQGLKPQTAAGLVTAISSTISGIGNFNNIFLRTAGRSFYLESIIPIVILLIAIFLFSKCKLPQNYKLFIGGFIFTNSLLFIFLYLKGSAIDENIRHLKFNFYLFTPVIASSILGRTKKYWAWLLFIPLFFYVDFFRLKKTWASNTYLTDELFYMSKTEVNEMPENIYRFLEKEIEHKKTICVSNYIPRWSISKKFICDVDSLPANLQLKKNIDLIFIDKDFSISKTNSTGFNILDTTIENCRVRLIKTQ
jgi:hypothetical protein